MLKITLQTPLQDIMPWEYEGVVIYSLGGNGPFKGCHQCLGFLLLLLSVFILDVEWKRRVLFVSSLHAVRFAE